MKHAYFCSNTDSIIYLQFSFSCRNLNKLSIKYQLYPKPPKISVSERKIYNGHNPRHHRLFLKCNTLHIIY